MQKGVDILILAECTLPLAEILLYLNKYKTSYRYCGGNKRNIHILTTLDRHEFEIKDFGSNYLLPFEISNDKSDRFLICGVHLPSDIFSDAIYKKPFLVSTILKHIEELKSKCNCERLFLIGDFNMPPYDEHMQSAPFFNATMTMSEAKNMKRVIGDRNENLEYNYFYNPMWSFLGDLSDFAPGTYYWDNNKPQNHHKWSMIDQILVSPQAIPHFKSIEIIHVDVNGSQLLSFGAKSSTKSDHLPINFSLSLQSSN